MTVTELVSKVLADEHGDALKEAVAFLADPHRSPVRDGRVPAVKPARAAVGRDEFGDGVLEMRRNELGQPVLVFVTSLT